MSDFCKKALEEFRAYEETHREAVAKLEFEIQVLERALLAAETDYYTDNWCDPDKVPPKDMEAIYHNITQRKAQARKEVSDEPTT